MFFQRKPALTRPVTFFSSSHVANTSSELMIDLFSGRADGKHLVQRLVLNPSFAAKVIAVVEKNLGAYEARFGHIRVARSAAPTEGEHVVEPAVYCNHVESTFTESEFFLDCRTVLVMKGKSPETLARLMAVATPGAIPPLVAGIKAAITSAAQKHQW